MGNVVFKKATKRAAKLRLALIGPAGSGKTYTGLLVASRLGARVAVIDTEKGSASKYADLFDFDVLELESFAPQQYVEALRAAESAGYDVVVVDSLSHAWVGKGGALEMHDNAVARQKGGNSFTAWRDVTPHHNSLVEALVQSTCHVIATMRAKTEYVSEKDERTGRTSVRKVGLAPVQRDGMEFEFDVVCDMDQENRLAVGKTRAPRLSGKVYHRPGDDFAGELLSWLSSGEPTEEKAAPVLKFVAPPRPAETVIRPPVREVAEAVAAKTGGRVVADEQPAPPAPPPPGPQCALERKLEAKDAALVAAGLIQSGELMAYVEECGRDAKFPREWHEWNKGECNVAGGWVRDFEAQAAKAFAERAERNGRPVTEEQMGELAAKLGEAQVHMSEAFKRAGLPATVKTLDDLNQGQFSAVLSALKQAHPLA